MSGSLRARAPGSLPLPKAASESAPVPAASSSIAQTADGPSPFPQEFLSCPARFLLSRRGGGRYQLAGASVTQACRKHTSDRYGDETSVVRMHSGNGPHEEMDE